MNSKHLKVLPLKNNMLRPARSIILFLFLCSVAYLTGQNSKTDVLAELIKKDKEDTVKVQHLLLFSQEKRNSGQFDTALSYASRGLRLAQKIDYKPILASAYNNISNVYLMKSDYPAALENVLKSISAWELILEQIGDNNNSPLLYKSKKGICAAQNNMGNIYYRQGSYPLALDYYLRSLKIKEELLKTAEESGNSSEIKEIKKAISYSYNNIGLIYDEQGDYDLSLQYYLKALDISRECENQKGIASAYNNIGGVYHNKNKTGLALESYFNGLEIQLALNDQQAMAMSYVNIGNVYKELAEKMKTNGSHADTVKHKLNDALASYFRSYKIFEELGDKHGLANACNGIGTAYGKLDNALLGIEYCNKSLAIGKEIGSKTDLRNSYHVLSKIYLQLKDYKKAYENGELYSIYHDSLLSDGSSKQIGDLKTNYAVEKKEIEMKAGQEKERALAEADKKRQEIFFWLVCSVAIAVASIAIIVFRNLRLTRKQKAIIEGQKQLVEEQKKLVEERQKEVLDSIVYAKRIQNSLLPTEKYIQRILKAKQ